MLCVVEDKQAHKLSIDDTIMNCLMILKIMQTWLNWIFS